MAIRENTILLKRSDVPGKVPLAGDIQLGELALNIADVKLYASGTTENDIVQIGWDRISRTGDTVTGDFIFNGGITATTISATTYNGDGSNLTGVYPSTNPSGFTSNVGTVTSVGLTVPSALSVTPSGITTSGTFTITGAGTASQYVRGDGVLGTFPTVGGGGGGSVYYLNGNTNQGSISGTTMYQFSKTPGTGAAANFTRNTTGTIASFITDAGDPNQLTVPSGIWLFHCYFSESGGGSNHATVQAIVEKWNGTSITVIGTGVVEEITNNSTKDLYTLGVTIPSGVTLTLTDRIVIQIQITNANGKTVTLYTEDGDLSSVLTTFANGISSINALTAAAQTLGVGSTGTDFTINSTGSTHTFNLPTASAINRGALSSTDWTVFNNKVSTGPITGSGLTMVTSRLLGRTTSLSGSIEEISIGTGLSLSSGTLSATSSTGVFGISNSGGTYTFYSTLSAAMSAATAGQTIEMFADVTGTTTVTLKPNVILFGNGHTYTYSGNTGDAFSTSPGSGTYFFYNMNIKRSNTATSTGVIFSADGTVFGTTLTFKCYNLTVTYTTTTGAAPIVTTTSFGIYGWVFDGIEVIGNSSGFLFPSVFSVNNIKNSRIENTGTGGGYSTANINGGSVIENTYVKTVSGVAISLNYTNQGDAARNCTAITTSSNGIAGGTAINCYSFSNSGIAIISNAFNCVATTVTGIAYYQSNAWNSIGTSSSTGVAVRPFFTMSSFYNCTFRSAGNATISDTNYPARFYNCSIENTWNSVSGHGILLNGVGVEVTNCSISVTNASANCIIGAGPISVKYANNSFRGATTPININVTQGITNTHDNQGNILI